MRHIIIINSTEGCEFRVMTGDRTERLTLPWGLYHILPIVREGQIVGFRLYNYDMLASEEWDTTEYFFDDASRDYVVFQSIMEKPPFVSWSST